MERSRDDNYYDAAQMSMIAIRLENAMSWHHASQRQAGIAERAGYRVRATKQVGWEVYATDRDFGDLVVQAADR